MLSTKTFKIASVFSMLLLVCNLFAQSTQLHKGYYISNSNDSVTGYFNLEKVKNNRIDYYRTPEKQDKVVLIPSDVKEIITQDSNSIYTQEVFLNPTTEKIFLYNLIMGEASLFVGKPSTGKEIFYVRLSDKNEMKRINEANPNALLFTLYPDCKKAISNNVRYNSDDLTKNFIKLNQCLNPKYVVIKNKELNRNLMNYGFRLMTAYNKPTTSLWWNTSSTHPYQNFGIGLDANLNISKSLSFDFGLWLTRRKILVDSFNIVRGLIYFRDQKPLYNYILYYHSDVDMRFSTWEIPLQLTYHFNKLHKKWRPFISVGFSIMYSTNYNISKDIDLPKTVEYGSNTPSPASLGLTLPSFMSSPIIVEGRDHYSLFASVGTYYKLNDHSFLNMGMKYANDAQYFKGRISSIQTKVNRIEFFLGYLFDKKKKY